MVSFCFVLWCRFVSFRFLWCHFVSFRVFFLLSFSFFPLQFCFVSFVLFRFFSFPFHLLPFTFLLCVSNCAGAFHARTSQKKGKQLLIMAHGKNERYEYILDDTHVELYVPCTAVCIFIPGSSDGCHTMVFSMTILLYTTILLMHIAEHFSRLLVHHGTLKLDDHHASHMRSPVGCCRDCTKGAYVRSVLGVEGFSKSTFQFDKMKCWF